MKGLATEIILTAGVLIAVGITVFQLRGVYIAQQQLSEEEVISAFVKDLEAIVDRATATTGDVTFIYYPIIKQYKVEIRSNVVKAFDKLAGKQAIFSKSVPEIVDYQFEDCEKIFILKKEGKIALMCECLELNKECTNSLFCCSGYCNQTSGKCEDMPICQQDRICPKAPEAKKDSLGRDCCPSEAPICTNGHCCPTDKPKWCSEPKKGNPRCVDNNEFKDEGCEEICPTTISQCVNHWHWNNYGGIFMMNIRGYTCNYFEVCYDPVVKLIAKEIIDCCNNKCLGNCHSFCGKALSDSGLSTTDTPQTRKKCYGLYTIYGLGPAKRWLRGYLVHIEEPASIMLTQGTWMCTGYSIVLTTLLRSVGYEENEAYSICGPMHAYNMVKFPGDTKFHIVDTVGNCPSNYRPGNIPACIRGYPYCSYGECSPSCMNDVGRSCPFRSEVYGC